MYPYGELEREFFVLKTFLFARYAYPYEYKTLFHFPLERPNYRYTAKNVALYLGQEHDLAALNAQLLEPSNLLFAMAHSNGIDMGLGNIILCPREQTALSTSVGIKAMPCFFNLALCSRAKPSNQIVKISQLKTQIAFFYTCWGIQLKNGLYDPQVSFARQLALSPHIGMIISTYTMSHLDNAIAAKFMHHFDSAMTLGTIINQLNAEHFQSYADIRHTLIVLGDPEFKLNQSLSSNFEQLFPEKVLSHLMHKGLIQAKQHHEVAMDTDICSAISLMVNDILYTKTVVLGSRALALSTMQDQLAAWMLFLDSLWILVLLIKKRLSQAAQRYINPNHLLIQLQQEVHQYHQYWVDYFVMMNANFGGLIRLQIDTFFDEKNKIPACDLHCPYCNGGLIEHELCLIEHEQLKRRVLECYSCTTIFDSHAIFTFARIACETFWLKDLPQTIKVHLCMSPHLKGIFHYTVCACLEPFYKKGQSMIASQINKGQRQIQAYEPQLIDITLENFMPLADYAAGQYYLNILVMVHTSVAVLRRTIYIKD
jgi:hypothetical protein